MNKATRFQMLVLVMVVLLALGVPTRLFAQRQSEDASLQKAREETEVVLDLGRLLGFIYRMVEEHPNLELSREQAVALRELMGEIRTTSRLTAPTARSMTARIEDGILTPAQLIHTDRLWIESERNRASATAQGSGVSARAGAGSRSTAPGTGTASDSGAAPAGSLAAYAAGGPYNPLIDTARQQGQDFEALYAYVRARAGNR